MAPIKMTRPFSKCGRRKSCFGLSKRWISSSKRMTVPLILASSMTICNSFFVSVAAFNVRKAYFVVPAMALAILVFPIPGGPYKIIEESCLAAIIRAIIFPGATKCCCPTTSSKQVGLIRNANG